MDPKQRLLLEVGYAALHGAGHSKPDLEGADVGVFVGLCSQDRKLAKRRTGLPEGSRLAQALGSRLAT